METNKAGKILSVCLFFVTLGKRRREKERIEQNKTLDKRYLSKLVFIGPIQRSG